ncbi:unnamed protein product [Lactuca virosa]|uniref:F-box domain-containing protein n=1 Tax=Lactuca virosa TaxID=75947 RepID=A0AAU9NZZ9_9ASTR|nr:unnamed protein product [Lactuca virosa]
MWSNLPSDLLSNIFSYLPPPSIPRATSVCRHWRNSARAATRDTRRHHHHPPWFIALPTNKNHFCFIHNPIENTWHSLNLKHVPTLIKPVSTIGGHGLILFKSTGGAPVQLSVCNPFTGQFGQLPPLQKPRTNPAVGIIEVCPGQFKVYVAGGMSEVASGGAASYESTLEMFDSDVKKWTIVGSMPVEFSVRLTVWTPNESVYSNGVLYWMTSARAYSIMGFKLDTNKWREFSVPMGYMLEFAALVPRNGQLVVVGGSHGGDVVVWELGEGGEWNVIERMPVELRKRFVGGSVKCVGIEGGVCLYRDMASGMVVWRRGRNCKDRWEWNWIKGCNRVSGRHIENYPIKGVFLHPNLASSPFI